MKNSIFQLLSSTFPTDFDIDKFKNSVPEDIWKKSEFEACRLALRKCPDINWEYYIKSIKNDTFGGMDVPTHYLKHGLYEGKKLFFNNIDRPLVSVIIANKNNGKYIKYCIESVQKQTLKDIEIIIVDDNSTDNSWEIITDLAQKDKRIKIFKNEKTMSQHMARKKGVAEAQGNAIMFLDSDDYFMPHACEVAYKVIESGYDIGAFNSTPICANDEYSSKMQEMRDYLKFDQEKIFEKDEIIKSIYINCDIPASIWSKIYVSKVCKEAFREMEDGNFPRAQDIYEGFAMASRAKKMKTIKNFLHIYRAFYGVSQINAGKSKIEAYKATGYLVKPLFKWTRENSIPQFYTSLFKIFLRNSVEAFVDHVKPDYVTEYLTTIVSQYGLIPFMKYIVEKYYFSWNKISDKFQYYEKKVKKAADKKRIGIIYNQLVNGGIENVLYTLVDGLIENGYDVKLFLHQPHPNDKKLNDKANILYLEEYKNDIKTTQEHLTKLFEVLKKNSVDIMLFHRPQREILLWETMLLKFLGISVVLFEHAAYYTRLFSKSKYSRDQYESVLRCLDKLIVLSKDAEVFYHIRGIDAQYVHNPISKIIEYASDKTINKKILFVGRFSDPVKQTSHALYALSEMIKKDHSIKMYFVGDFDLEKDKKNFYDLAKNLGVLNNIEFSGWVDNPGQFMTKCSIIIMTSFTECFPLGLSEAQAHGLPAVIYELPIAICDNNESIVQVEQGNYKAMAKAVLDLLGDGHNWKRLSNIAKENTKKFSVSKYNRSVNDILNTLNQKSNIEKYDPQIYQRIMRTLSFYTYSNAPL